MLKSMVPGALCTYIYFPVGQAPSLVHDTVKSVARINRNPASILDIAEFCHHDHLNHTTQKRVLAIVKTDLIEQSDQRWHSSGSWAVHLFEKAS